MAVNAYTPWPSHLNTTSRCLAPTKHEGGGVKMVVEERVTEALFVTVRAISERRPSDKRSGSDETLREYRAGLREVAYKVPSLLLPTNADSLQYISSFTALINRKESTLTFRNSLVA
ncbi:hypothetical protein E2P81_ATG08584 [Venturia nashicola]|nr:hypothetical protein E2P81_ATG08584 [Venturia nashicola]